MNRELSWHSPPTVAKHQVILYQQDILLKEAHVIQQLGIDLDMGVSKNRVPQNGWFIMENPI